MDNDRERAEKALSWIQDLYATERKAREEELSPDQRKELRLEASLPIINTLGAWIHAEVLTVLPKSQIGKAMAYSAKRWDALSEYLHDGLLEIDNNLVENAIRPLALGRKTTCLPGHTTGPGGPQWSIPCWERASCMESTPRNGSPTCWSTSCKPNTMTYDHYILRTSASHSQSAGSIQYVVGRVDTSGRIPTVTL